MLQYIGQRVTKYSNKICSAFDNDNCNSDNNDSDSGDAQNGCNVQKSQ